MSAIRGSLPELVARLEALDAQREALRALIAQRLNLGGAGHRAQARAPERPRAPSTSTAKLDAIGKPLRGERAREVLAMAKTHGVLESRHLVEACGIDQKAAASCLSRLSQFGKLVRVGNGRYSLPGKAAKPKADEIKWRKEVPRRAKPGPKPGTPSRQAVGPGERMAQLLLLAADLEKQGESLTAPRVAAALGITANNAQVTMAKLAREGKLRRAATGIYLLPSKAEVMAEEAESDEDGAKDTDRAVALAMSNDGVVTADAIVAAGIKHKRPLALAMLRKLHHRGRLERIAPETYATPDKAASLRALKKMERAAEKNAERAP